MRNNNFDIYLEKIKNFYWKRWYIPSFKFIKDIIWISSNDAISRFFNIAVEEWYFEKDEDSNRYIPLKKLLSFNVYASVKAWASTEVEADNIVDSINIEKYLIWWDISNIILVEVKWDSMEDAWIMEWDIVIIDTSNKYPKMYDIVVWKVDWENFTLKRYYKDNKWRPCLKYENEKIYWEKLIYPEQNLETFWVVKGLIRRF